MGSKFESGMKGLLTKNLQKYVEQRNKDEGDPVCYAEYCKAESRLVALYSEAPYYLGRGRILKVIWDVKYEAFNVGRMAVDSQLKVLRCSGPERSERAMASACLELGRLFEPWYELESYYNAEYLASQGGLPVLIDILQSSPSSKLDQADSAFGYAAGADPDVLTSANELHGAALSACWQICGDGPCRRQLVDHGILSAVDPLLKKGDQAIVQRCLGLLWGLLEYEDVQVNIKCPGN